MASLLDRMHPRSCTCAEGFLSKGRSNDSDSPSKKRSDLHERVVSKAAPRAFACPVPSAEWGDYDSPCTGLELARLG